MSRLTEEQVRQCYGLLGMEFWRASKHLFEVSYSCYCATCGVTAQVSKRLMATEFILAHASHDTEITSAQGMDFADFYET